LAQKTPGGHSERLFFTETSAPIHCGRKSVFVKKEPAFAKPEDIWLLKCRRICEWQMANRLAIRKFAIP
jgi:hypothetical protein